MKGSYTPSLAGAASKSDGKARAARAAGIHGEIAHDFAQVLPKHYDKSKRASRNQPAQALVPTPRQLHCIQPHTATVTHKYLQKRLRRTNLYAPVI
jgi:tRNA U34 5-carboxymethylaminomethyl modifying enzyme MnmG/GidA